MYVYTFYVCVCMYVCMYVCMHVCMHVCDVHHVCACMYAYLYVGMVTCINLNTYICAFRHMFRHGTTMYARLFTPRGGPETLLVNLVPEVDRSVPPTAEVLKLQNYCDHTFKSWSLWMPSF